MNLRSGLLYIYSSYTHIEQVTNPFLLYSQLQDLCKDNYKTKDQVKEFFEISKRLNIIEVLINKGLVDGKRYLNDIYPIYSSYFSLEQLNKYTTLVIDVIEYKNTSVSKFSNQKTVKEISETPVKLKQKKKKKQPIRYVIENGVLTSYNGKLKVVSIPANVREIAPFAFTNKSYQKIEKIVIPDTVERIHSFAIYGLPNLKEVKLGKVKKIDKFAFENCDCIINCKNYCKPPLWHNNWNVKSKFLFIKKRLTAKYGV